MKLTSIKLIFALIFSSIFIISCTTDINNSNNTDTACTADAKLCPDGTAVRRVGPNCEFAECPTSNIPDLPEQFKCNSDSRLADFCTQEYDPVCGWFAENIQCIKYPCANTYSNSCFACSNSDVLYWTEGECPK